MDDRISIIVSTYKRKEKLIRLLDSFSRLRCRCPFEFIIVDSASNDGTDELVHSWSATIDFADVKYQILPERAPLAHTRNFGISLSTGNILAFTDDDCVVDPDWLDQLYGRLISCPDYAGAGGRVLPVGEDIYSRYNTMFHILEPPSDINAVITANCVFWKQPVVDAGLFDEFFTVLGGEDIALCMKLWLRGYRFGFEEKAIVYHEYRQTLRDFISTFFHYGNGEKVLYLHYLEGYLRYRQYPEKKYNHLGFRNHSRFLVFFFRTMVYDIIGQVISLRNLSSSRKEWLMLSWLFAVSLFSYHLGRGTFFGILSKKVEDFLADHPNSLLKIDPCARNHPPVMEITDDTIPTCLKPGQQARSSVIIKNLLGDRFLSTRFHVVLENAEDNSFFFKTPQSPDMVIFPLTETEYTFTLTTPVNEQNVHVKLFLATPEGICLCEKRGKHFTVSSALVDSEV